MLTKMMTKELKQAGFRIDEETATCAYLSIQDWSIAKESEDQSEEQVERARKVHLATLTRICAGGASFKVDVQLGDKNYFNCSIAVDLAKAAADPHAFAALFGRKITGQTAHGFRSKKVK